jgi:hypothetical protein
MTISGFCALPGFVKHGYDFAQYSLFGDTDLSYHLCVAFQSYLLLDIGLGSIFYRSQITVLNGYFHHALYSWVVLYSLYTRLNMVFLLFWPEELPMLLMSLGALNPSIRVNMRFGFTYFVTRILWHIYLMRSLFQQDKAIGAVAALILPLNGYWFIGWVKQNLRRRRARKLEESSGSESEVESDVEELEGEKEKSKGSVRRRKVSKKAVEVQEQSRIARMRDLGEKTDTEFGWAEKRA